MSAAKFKAGTAIVGKIKSNMDRTGVIVSIVLTPKAPNFKVRWSTGIEEVVTARAIRLPAALPVPQAAALPNQGALPDVDNEDGDQANSGLDSDNDSQAGSNADSDG
jgi:hypothetical protein